MCNTCSIFERHASSYHRRKSRCEPQTHLLSGPAAIAAANHTESIESGSGERNTGCQRSARSSEEIHASGDKGSTQGLIHAGSSFVPSCAAGDDLRRGDEENK